MCISIQKPTASMGKWTFLLRSSPYLLLFKIVLKVLEETTRRIRIGYREINLFPDDVIEFFENHTQ